MGLELTTGIHVLRVRRATHCAMLPLMFHSRINTLLVWDCINTITCYSLMDSTILTPSLSWSTIKVPTLVWMSKWNCTSVEPNLPSRGSGFSVGNQSIHIAMNCACLLISFNLWKYVYITIVLMLFLFRYEKSNCFTFCICLVRVWCTCS